MSVLIKDMEMPETCDDCPFHVYHSHYEYVCKATPMFYPMNLANSKGIRKDWCPLIEADEIRDMLESPQPEPCEDAEYYRGKIDGIKECTARLRLLTAELKDREMDGGDANV